MWGVHGCPWCALRHSGLDANSRWRVERGLSVNRGGRFLPPFSLPSSLPWMAMEMTKNLCSAPASRDARAHWIELL